VQGVLVIDKNKQPLMPCHPARARELLKNKKAAVYKRFPFTLILVEREGGDVQEIAFKIDPGSKQTGIALVANHRVVWAAVLEHRGQQIKMALESRHSLRHGRRSRHTRYRPARYMNRHIHNGWLPPSLQSCIENTWTWLCRINRIAPITSISQELVRFDMQLMENAEISGIEYQQGELVGYEIREYLLEKWGRKCAYCGKKDFPLEIEHITPKVRGGSNRVSNLTLACHQCNQAKGRQTAQAFGYPEIQKRAKTTLKDAAAVNSTRWALYKRLQTTGLPVEIGTGGQTKFNRISQGYPKAHWIDAACICQSGEKVRISPDYVPLCIKATGHGSRKMCRTDKYGVPARHRLRQKRHFGIQTGDMVKALVQTGKYAGTHTGRVACRATGSFDIKTEAGKITTNHSYWGAFQYFGNRGTTHRSSPTVRWLAA